MVNPKYTPRTVTDFIAVHCSASKASSNVDADTIRGWHLAQGWIDIGYHLVIPRNGKLQLGRPLDAVGSHVEGYNSRAIGICLVGGLDEDGKPQNNFTPAQFDALETALRFCRLLYGSARIQGHRDFPAVKKDCPCFDVRTWVENHTPDLL